MSCEDKNPSNVRLPLLPLRDVVVFPHMIMPLFVGRDKSIAALHEAIEEDRKILLVAQKNAQEDDPEIKDLYQVGTIATILQLLKLPDGTVKVLIEGIERVTIQEIFLKKQHMEVAYQHISQEKKKESSQMIAMSRALIKLFKRYAKLSKKIPEDIITTVSELESSEKIVDIIAAQLPIRIEDKQKTIELILLEKRQEFMMDILKAEIDFLEVEKQVRGRVKQQMERSQREYYLTEQMKAIQKELGAEDEQDEIACLKEKINTLKMPQEVYEKLSAELKKLKQMSPMSAEATVVRSYIDWMLSIPWQKKSRTVWQNALGNAEKILNKEHYGLTKVKERILEYLAVQQRTRKIKGPVLCLVGPPGVGKTSLGESIAKAVNRKFIRIALGGVRDEAEIRGHRRTYIGSMPGRIMQKMAKTGVKNPLILLDEVDKMGADFRGDPASAMLEVLDPEQNKHFNDHYLEVDYDLSSVMFICTANSLDIPPALLDRMEIIQISGYTENEKLNIAKSYLIPKQRRYAGLRANEIIFDDQAIRHLIRFYTKEAGVRGLEREMAKVCRKLVKNISLNDIDIKYSAGQSVQISSDNVESYSGVARFNYGVAEEKDQIGLVTGLAWTKLGGELLSVESVVVAGKGKVVKTGSLGDVMQESIQAALTVVRSHAVSLGIVPNFHEMYDLHIHVPEGATPKDGPSAGIAMCIAMISVLTKTPVKAEVAMTGEINLRGQVLEIGGLKEKLLAAHRGGIKHVIIPHDNVKDLHDIPNEVKRDVKIHPVRAIEEVIRLVLHAPSVESEAKRRHVVMVNNEEVHTTDKEVENQNCINTH